MTKCEKCKRCEARWRITLGDGKGAYLCDECREEIYEGIREGALTVVVEEELLGGWFVYVYEIVEGEQVREEAWCPRCGRLVAWGEPFIGWWPVPVGDPFEHECEECECS